MQMLAKICYEPELSLPFNYENIEGTNLRPVKAMQGMNAFLHWGKNLLKKHAHPTFYWPRYACINLSDVDLLI